MHKLIIYGICAEEFLNNKDHLPTTAFNKLYNTLGNHQAAGIKKYFLIEGEKGFEVNFRTFLKGHSFST